MLEIDRLAADGHYETQERLITRIVHACAGYSEIDALDIGLRKSPVLEGSGSLGVRLSIDTTTLMPCAVAYLLQCQNSTEHDHET
jgi:hypothetical protein